MSSLPSASSGRIFPSTSNDNFIFTQLPFIIPEYAERVETYRGYFTGVPTTVLYEKNAEEDTGKADNEVKQSDKDSLADSEDELEESSLALHRKEEAHS